VVVRRVRRLEVGRHAEGIPHGEALGEEALADALTSAIRVGGEEAEVGVWRLCGAAGLESFVQGVDRRETRRRQDAVQQGLESFGTVLIELVLAGR